MDAFIQDPELLREFLIESEELLQGVDQDLVRLESSPKDDELLNRVFRAMHTIKGTAGFLGLEPVVKLGHHAEDVLTNLRKGQIQLTQGVMDALLAARDELGKMLADIRAGGLKQYELDPLVAQLQQAQSAAGAEAEATPQPPESSPESSHIEQPVENVTKPAKKTHERESAESAQKARNSQSLAAQTMRVDVRKLDELLNLIGELVLERNRLLQISKEISGGRMEARGADSPLNHAVGRLSFITEEIQAAGLRTRMVPIETVFSKFPRLVRDLARTLQKDVELEVSGQETEIDKTMVELIGDPLVHLVRNSLDHGLEMPDARERANKPRCGKIRLEAKQEGDHILVAISDDGAGMDPARILRKAIERGLVTAERGATLSQREILDFIYLPGFSTVDKATNLSGRGVGMDVVCSNLKKLNGTVEIDSRLGEGTRVEVRLPLTLAILPVLLVEAGGEIYALPLRDIIETSRFDPGDVHEFESSEVICLRRETLPLLRLQTIFSTPVNDSAVEKKIVVMSVSGVKVALLVDRLIGQESTVVKPLAATFNQSQGIAGTTVGGDGWVRLVIDPAGLLLSAGGTARRELVQ